MPEAVHCWRDTQSFDEVNEKHHDLIATYRDDFAKYAGSVDVEHLNSVLSSVPRLLSNKVQYSRIERNAPSQAIKKAINLLAKARICHKVQACSASGLPLNAEINEKVFKLIMLDCGMASTLLGLTIQSIQQTDCLNINTHGGMGEQLVGQLLRTLQPHYVKPELFYWAREEKGSSAEVDYLIPHNTDVIPIEVKAGKAGKLKSLHYFADLKKTHLAIRPYAGNLVMTNVDTMLFDGKQVNYQLLSIPYYLIGQVHRLIDEILKS